MSEKPKETPKEELECPKKYVYDTGIIFECKDNIRVEIIGEDVVDLLNELATKCSKLEKENEELKQEYLKLDHRHGLLHDVCLDAECERDSLKKDVESLEKENEQLKTKINIFEKFLDENNLDIDWEIFCTVDECKKDSDDYGCKECKYLGDVE